LAAAAPEAYVSAYVSIRQHTSAYVSIRRCRSACSLAAAAPDTRRK
jgi:hypothetical protein